MKRKLKRIDSDNEDGDKPGGAQVSSARFSSRLKLLTDCMQEGTPDPTSEDEEFDFEDESDHQDYDANYFDNGEGEDDESGGEEGESSLIVEKAAWILMFLHRGRRV